MEPRRRPSFPPPGAGWVVGEGVPPGGVSVLRPRAGAFEGRGSTRLADLRLCSVRSHLGVVPIPVGALPSDLPAALRNDRVGLVVVTAKLRNDGRNDRYSGIADLPIVDPGPIWRADSSANVPPLGFSADLAGWRLHPSFLSGCPCRSRVFGVPSRTSRFARRRISFRQAPRSGPGPGSGPSGGRGDGGS